MIMKQSTRDELSFDLVKSFMQLMVILQTMEKHPLMNQLALKGNNHSCTHMELRLHGSLPFIDWTSKGTNGSEHMGLFRHDDLPFIQCLKTTEKINSKSRLHCSLLILVNKAGFSIALSTEVTLLFCPSTLNRTIKMQVGPHTTFSVNCAVHVIITIMQFSQNWWFSMKLLCF